MIYLYEILQSCQSYILEVKGELQNLQLNGITAWDNAKHNTISWVNKKVNDRQRTIENLASRVIVCGADIKYTNKIKQNNKILILSDHPRLLIMRIANMFQKPMTTSIAETAIIHTDAIIGQNVTIGNNCIIGKCSIGDDCHIMENTFIADGTIIGSNCIINISAVIGCESGGIERDIDYSLTTFPHTSNVIIGNNVHIGPRTIITKGVLTPTIIRDGASIDSGCIIGHNTIIGETVYIAAAACISGSVNIGTGCNIFSGCIISEWVEIGEYSVIGMGSIVNKNIPAYELWYGHPAKLIRKLNAKYLPFE